MTPNPYVLVHIDLSRLRQNAEQITQQTAVPLIAVVKADAYGFGARQVATTLADRVEGFYVFDAVEAIRYDLHRLTGKRSIALIGESDDPADYLAHHIHPAVWTRERALLLRKAGPALSIDTGQGRFGCAPETLREILDTGAITEAFTHASTPRHLANFQHLAESVLSAYRPALRLHAASTALLNDPAARYDAVRVGLALYAGAARVTARLIEVHDGGGSERGYTGFRVPHYGVIRCGYSNRFRTGPCVVNGIRQKVLEVGMQSAFVEIGPTDRAGDEVVLLGDGLTETEVAAEWHCTPHEVLLRLCNTGRREY